MLKRSTIPAYLPSKLILRGARAICRDGPEDSPAQHE
jgi:hypothetical protein